jgi:ankyrin repeat protein
MLIKNGVKTLIILGLFCRCGYEQTIQKQEKTIGKEAKNEDNIKSIMEEVKQASPNEEALIDWIGKSEHINYLDENNIPILFFVVGKNLKKTLSFIIQNKKGDIDITDEAGNNIFLKIAYEPVDIEVLNLLLPFIENKSLGKIAHFLLDSLFQITHEEDRDRKLNKDGYYNYYFEKVLNTPGLNLNIKENELTLLNKAIVYCLQYKSRKVENKNTENEQEDSIVTIKDRIVDKMKSSYSQSKLNLTLLGYIKSNNTEAVKLLVSRGADPFATVQDQDPLIEATKSGNKEIIDFLLLDSWVYDTTKDSKGKNLLHIAAENGHLDILPILLDKGGKSFINTVDNNEEAPLLKAAFNGHLEIARLLLKSGANRPSLKEITDALLKKAKVEPTKKFLLAFPDAIASLGTDGQELSHLAVEKDNIALVKSLLHEGKFNIHARDNHQKTPLYYVKSEELLNLLIDQGAEPNSTDSSGRTPLYYVPRNLIKPLIKRGANPDVQDLNGNTPIYLATCERQPMIIKALKENGANPNIINLQGLNAYDAILLGEPDVYNDYSDEELVAALNS